MAEIDRQFLYVPSSGTDLFGWLHSPNFDRRLMTVVICNPLGVEYMSGHRSIRHLADQLASDGIPTLRFDYSRAGDSSGGDLLGATVHEYVSDIERAVEFLRKSYDDSPVALIGIGLGATFAAMVAHTTTIDALVLWNPTSNGRRFIREQRLLSELLNKEHGTTDENIDSAGIYITMELQNEFRGVDLANLPWSGGLQSLIVSRTDMDQDAKLHEAMVSAGATVTRITAPGYRQMMDHPTDTVVPMEAIGNISDWIVAQCPEPLATRQASKIDRTTSIEMGHNTSGEASLIESAHLFGAADHLFGIVTRPKVQTELAHTAYVFLNCGSEHHAGPHRMYTIMARLAARQGYSALRFDIEGIGDSISIGNNVENRAYSNIATDDLRAALEFLQNNHGCNRYILAGICAGAYHSYKGAAEIEDFEIDHAILMNPLVFEWNYNDPDDHFRFEANTYRGAIRDASRWKKLLSGKADYRRLLRALGSQFRERTRSLYKKATRIVGGAPAPGLPQGLTTIFRLKRKLHLLLAEDDPGLEIMKIQAATETASGIDKGFITVQHLPHSNHGFSKKSMQDRLIDRFLKLLKR